MFSLIQAMNTPLSTLYKNVYTPSIFSPGFPWHGEEKEIFLLFNIIASDPLHLSNKCFEWIYNTNLLAGLFSSDVNSNAISESYYVMFL